MTHFALRAIEACNPHTIVLEEAREYLGSASQFILDHVLKRLGYNVASKIIDPVEYGELTGRRRSVIIASNGPIFWPMPSSNTRKLGDILEDVPESEWFDERSKPWLFRHWATQTAKGNGFKPPVLTSESTLIPTIKKRYWAMQGDNFVIGHPTRPGTCRWLTIGEGKRIMGIPDLYILPEAKTTAGEMIGQGVIVSLFKKIIEAATGKAQGVPATETVIAEAA